MTRSATSRPRRTQVVTFNTRVEQFWSWFKEASPRFYEYIEAGGDYATESTEKLDELLPGFGWVYGPGKNDVGHSFTLTGEGNIHLQLLALHWLSKAPAIDGWTFYAAKQGGGIKGHSISTNGIYYKAGEIWVTPRVNTEYEEIDLTVWHHAWDEIGSSERARVTFLFLDEALGEYKVDSCIGEVRYERDKLKQAFPLEELPEYLQDIVEKMGWKKYDPGTMFTTYKVTADYQGFSRADITVQTTMVPKLFHQYMSAAGNIEDPLEGTGADYVYVSILRDFFPEGQEAKIRGEIEDHIDHALRKLSSGRSIGGAYGSEHCYCDFLIYDGYKSIAAIEAALDRFNLPDGTAIEFFARQKQMNRVVL